MNFLGSQVLLVLTPVIESVLSSTELTQIARLLERRDSIPRLITLIEARATPRQGVPAQ